MYCLCDCHLQFKITYLLISSVMFARRVKTEMADVMAVVMSDGTVLWVPPTNYLVRSVHNDDDNTDYTELKSVTQRRLV